MMTMEVSPNGRDGVSTGSSSTSATTSGTAGASSASLQLSVEQWELLRRLRNSHLSKAQIIRAYDELDRLDRELGNLFNSAPAAAVIASANQSTDPVSPTAIVSSPLSNNNANQNNKRSHGHSINGFSVNRPSNGYHSSSSSAASSSHMHHSTSTSNVNLRSARGSLHDINSSMTNQHETINAIDIEEETRELQELLAYVFPIAERKEGKKVIYQ